jgi:VWFA-related protein
MLRLVVPFVLVIAAGAAVADDQVVFKSDVAMTRVDSQVVDRDGRAITGLQVSDFILRVDGRVVPIRNFASENMPIDILLLLDVSGSMQPHVQRIASAAEQALNVLAEKDRVAIMVFDTSTRVRLPFRSSHGEVTGELNRLLRSERFNRGTRITSALLDAAKYVQREARPDARRAIVILTDDETQDEANEGRVESALARANAVLSFLQAPYEQPGMGGGRRRGPWGHGGGWPGGGGGIGFPGRGPVILGPGGQGPYGRGDPSHSAGTAAIAADSGGDTMQVEGASALEDTLARLRQRYALYFYIPEGAKPADQQSVQVDLSRDARLRYRDAETRSRRVYIMAGDSRDNEPAVVARRQEPSNTSVDPPASQDETTPKRRKVAVNDDAGPRVNTVDTGGGSSSEQASPPPAASAPSVPNTPAAPNTPPAVPVPQHGGWPRANPQNSNPN